MSGRDLGALLVPPHSIEAEQAVLGGLLLLNAAFERVADLITEPDFYRAEHCLLWRTIARLIEDNKPADVLTVAEELKRGNVAGDVTITYLYELASRTPSAANIRRYAELVRDHAVRRAIIAAAVAMQEEAYQAHRPIGDVIEQAHVAVSSLGEQRSATEPQRMRDVLVNVMQALDSRHRGEDQRIPTGLADLDRMLHGGLRGGRLYVIAGRPSSGKSALALQIALHAATHGHAAMVASLEMADDENGERALAATAKVDLDRVITGKLEQEHWDRLGSAIGTLNQLPIYFDDAPAVTLHQLRARARRQRHRHGIQLLVVDYLQLMRADERGENRNQEVGAIAEGLKALAKELGIAVVALSQMNRDCEKRTNRRGIVADLRDSGGIDAAADFIAFVYREEMYTEDTPAHGVAEIIVRKVRQGRPGTVYTIFRGEFARFENAVAGYTPDYSIVPDRRPPTRRQFSEAT